MKKNAFTLVEIVIALVIIGIISALTIPTLISDQKQQYVSGLKKAYTTLYNATEQIKASNSGTMVGLWTHNNGVDNDILRDKYCTYLKCTKKCATGAGEGSCYAAGSQYYAKEDAGIYHSDAQLNDSVILSDGMSLSFFADQPDCSVNWYVKNGKNVACAGVTVDVNGFKGPNIVGRDIFIFLIYKDGIIPDGIDAGAGDIGTCPSEGCTGAACTGESCGAQVLQQGRMTY